MNSLYGITIIAYDNGEIEVQEGQVKISSQTDNYVFLDDRDDFFLKAYPFCYRKVIMKDELHHMLVHSKATEIEINYIGYGYEKDLIRLRAEDALFQEIQKRKLIMDSWILELCKQKKEVDK